MTEEDKKKSLELIKEIRDWTQEKIWYHDPDGSQLCTHHLNEELGTNKYPDIIKTSREKEQHVLFEVMFRKVGDRLIDLEKLIEKYFWHIRPLWRRVWL